jgi:hydrogenase maturation protease
VISDESADTMAETTVNDTTPSDSSFLRRPSGRSNIRIIGLGNEWRGDDAAGLVAARRLRDRIGEGAQIIEAQQAGTDLLDLMDGARGVLLIDAVSSGKTPGTIHRLDASTSPIAWNLACRSTHGVGVAETIELGRTLGRLPDRVIIYGIEVAETGWGPSLSQQVEEAVDQVVERVTQEVEESECTSFTS